MIVMRFLGESWGVCERENFPKARSHHRKGSLQASPTELKRGSTQRKEASVAYLNGQADR